MIPGHALARDLTLRERVEAQRAIERIYYSHQIGTTVAFEQAVPEAVLEAKVRTYLKQTDALERFWGTHIDAEALHRESKRIAERTRMPERLNEIYNALGRDPFLIEECLARQALVGRLSRRFFSTDQRIHGSTRETAEDLRSRLVGGRIGILSEDPHRTVVQLDRTESSESGKMTDRTPQAGLGSVGISRMELPPEEFKRWRDKLPTIPGEVGPLEEEPDAFSFRILLSGKGNSIEFANYRFSKITWDSWWNSAKGGFSEEEAPAVASRSSFLPSSSNTDDPCPPDDTWDNGILDNLPEARSGSGAVWTGSLMVVWGGSTGLSLNTGGRYDPVTDTWFPTSTVNAPIGRWSPVAIWTGSRMLVWGGDYYDGQNTIYTNTGGLYDPVSDTWIPTSTTNAPTSRSSHSLVWTGSRLIVWGGRWAGGFLLTGGIYDPSTDTWSATSTTGAPSARSRHTAVWTGSLMLVWGGFGTTGDVNTGARFNPATNSWTAITTTGAPVARNAHSAVWSGTRMLVWGGKFQQDANLLNSGGQYNPSTNTWTAMSTANAPEARSDHTAVWTGSRMMLWGGTIYVPFSLVPTATGGVYDPAADSWIPTSLVNAPMARATHSAVWTGVMMIVWGGGTSTGGRYVPSTDSWTPTSTYNEPQPVAFSTAVWTGNLDIVWGGGGYSLFLNTGGSYDPLLDMWTRTSLTDAPDGRTNHTAVWTGNEMIIWGGLGGVAVSVATGGRYNPISDSWTPTSLVGAPSARHGHVSYWTGSRMLVWGGMDPGGRYDPESDTWTSISTVNQPQSNTYFTGVWTGNQMVVWGGDGPSYFMKTGGRYNPLTDIWSPTSTLNAPEGRELASAVWTGSRMVVWGGYNGDGMNTGGRYDPVADSWQPTSLTNVPSPRYHHTAISADGLMIIWGGDALSTGGRYNPETDIWTATSLASAPAPRNFHTAVWSGRLMIIWGESEKGGRYVVTPDLDQDGITACSGDCDDHNPAVHPGASELCNGVDDNCNDSIDEGFDVDSDGITSCSGDCDDSNNLIYPGAPEVCNGLDDNCNGSTDEGGDGLCEDVNSCTVDVCGGQLGCLHTPVMNGSPCEDGNACTSTDQCQSGTCVAGAIRDADSDGHPDFFCGGDDCKDSKPFVWLPALEVNNLTVTAIDPTFLSWDDQRAIVGSETVYDLVTGALGASPLSTTSCMTYGTGVGFLDIRDAPLVGTGYWYLVRARNTCGGGTYGTAPRDASVRCTIIRKY